MVRFMPNFFSIAYYNRKETSLAFSEKIGTNPGEDRIFSENIDHSFQNKGAFAPKCLINLRRLLFFLKERKAAYFPYFQEIAHKKQVSKVPYACIFLSQSVPESEIRDSERGLFDKLPFLSICYFPINASPTSCIFIIKPIK